MNISDNTHVGMGILNFRGRAKLCYYITYIYVTIFRRGCVGVHWKSCPVHMLDISSGSAVLIHGKQASMW